MEVVLSERSLNVFGMGRKNWKEGHKPCKDSVLWRETFLQVIP